MNIKINSHQALYLAEYFAGVIHHELCLMHLRVTWGIWSVDAEYAAPDRAKGSEFLEMQEAIRSITDKLDRINFLAQVRYHFKAKCKERGTKMRWQDYRASVLAAHAEHQAKIAAYNRRHPLDKQDACPTAQEATV